jgi:hypothetical protein
LGTTWVQAVEKGFAGHSREPLVSEQFMVEQLYHK